MNVNWTRFSRRRQIETIISSRPAAIGNCHKKSTDWSTTAAAGQSLLRNNSCRQKLLDSFFFCLLYPGEFHRERGISSTWLVSLRKNTTQGRKLFDITERTFADKAIVSPPTLEWVEEETRVSNSFHWARERERGERANLSAPIAPCLLHPVGVATRRVGGQSRRVQ